MDFFKQYLKIINYALMGLAFMFSSFYLLVNAYHYIEIRKDFYAEFDTQSLVLDLEDSINQIESNLSVFQANSYKGNIPTSQMLVVQDNLKSCVNSFHNETFESMSGKNKISIVDVYNLRESYENNVLNDCIVGNLHWTTNLSDTNINSSYLVQNQSMINLYVKSLSNETTYLRNDLINNSSYFFNTTSASFVKNNTRDGFYEVMNAYNRAANYVVFISDWFKNEVEGNYD